ncbi:hypothetical protein J8TS2_39050 [Lederbergia ruris]|uniref:Uncharacterized protein n=1 Tax=Lederbergia ruris TaxID=217495 RepID=A0ABQ4KNQ6_9BACI|nr:hypothetical protein [Lederbergia ruris]GIN59586.1 hypothetical protein J8TS2_39050 [Lederbergia ruris]
MESSTINNSSNEKKEESNNLKSQVSNEAISESIDTIAFYLFEAIKRKSNHQFQKKGA